jgi:hypothetical protein
MQESSKTSVEPEQWIAFQFTSWNSEDKFFVRDFFAFCEEVPEINDREQAPTEQW